MWGHKLYILYISHRIIRQGGPRTGRSMPGRNVTGKGEEERRRGREGKDERRRVGSAPSGSPAQRALWCVYITIIIVGVPRLIDAYAPTVFGRHIQAG